MTFFDPATRGATLLSEKEKMRIKGFLVAEGRQVGLAEGQYAF